MVFRWLVFFLYSFLTSHSFVFFGFFLSHILLISLYCLLYLLPLFFSILLCVRYVLFYFYLFFPLFSLLCLHCQCFSWYFCFGLVDNSFFNFAMTAIADLVFSFPYKTSSSCICPCKRTLFYLLF